MTGILCPSQRRRLCKSSPLNPGICRSVITHFVSGIMSDPTNCSADSNVRAGNPSERTKSSSPLRAQGSSSTMQITDGQLNLNLGKREPLQANNTKRGQAIDPVMFAIYIFV